MTTKFDDLAYVYSQLAQYYVANELNKLNIKAVVEKETGGPDIKLNNGWIEIATTHPGQDSVNLYSRKLKSFSRWGDKYGKKKLLVYLDMNNGKLYAASFEKIIKQIENKKLIPQQDLRNTGEIYYTIEKQQLIHTIEEIGNYFSENA